MSMRNSMPVPARMACVVGVTPGVVAVAATYALERHDQQTGCSQEQRECVQVHLSIEP
jgi:GTP cyclohydrolase III